MCILFIYRNPNANSESYRLILVANRDEYLKRAALPAHYWKNHPVCLGGIDMESGKEGGTWLGVSLTGKAGVVLNLSSSEKSSTNIPKQGRGFLVSNFIISKHSATSYLDQLHKENKEVQYNPFLLVLLNLQNADVKYLSNSRISKGPISVEDNILGFSNGLDILYKKVEAGKEIFKNIIKNVKVSKQTVLIEELLTFMKSKKRYLPDAELQKSYPTKYKEYSSIFVSTDWGYCTRTHSILLVNGNNEITFIEETLMPDLTWKRQIFNNRLM
ncbi:transport and Golgi organization 2 homolog [Apis dorsata]|uniref:transport and Golgi organization 2 homolog n=1 Tax=Apis dorsata TaxID=7462 RepID=UPI0003DF64CC|nr:transport and Golgi organization 2 homolog [Apis dorsata]